MLLPFGISFIYLMVYVVLLVSMKYLFTGRGSRGFFGPILNILISILWASRLVFMIQHSPSYPESDRSLVMWIWRTAVFAGGFWEDFFSLLLDPHKDTGISHIFPNRFLLGIMGAVLCVVPEFAAFLGPSTSAFCYLTDWKLQALGFVIMTIARFGQLLHVSGFFLWLPPPPK
jgi:hypothetical protein